ncbi:MAG: serine--tRNA ligase [Clostridia bacterium]|nr:serine--tRNA ligase [Clostridia bacterium]
MIDINLIRENPDLIKEKLAKKLVDVDFTELLEKDKERKDLMYKTDTLKAERNKTSALVPQLKKEGKDVTEIIENMKKLGDEIKENDDKIAELDEFIYNFISYLPNPPADDLLAGGKENNKEIKSWGEKPKFDFEPKHHVDIAENLGMIDYKRGAKLGGNGFWIYRKDGAKLEWALLNYFIEQHLSDGYEFMLLPHLLLKKCGFGAGQFPKFADEVFHIDNTSDNSTSFLLPTAETALVNLHSDEILDEDELPFKYCGYTPCYRKEAGSYRAEERGMIRGHQFNKVEMVQYTTPENSEKAFEELLNKAAALVQGLGLHYRISKLAAADCSHSMARTCDIEVWIPSMNDYKEVSSVSNAYDYQARRNNTKFRRKDTGKLEYVHTLNGSGLATSRILPAIMEQYQNADGSVTVPEVLRKWVGKDVITK